MLGFTMGPRKHILSWIARQQSTSGDQQAAVSVVQQPTPTASTSSAAGIDTARERPDSRAFTVSCSSTM